MARDESEIKFDVALSFAGEDRAVVKKLATLLEAKGLRVFYDEFKKAELWGHDLIQYLDGVYFRQARYCMMFVSEAYARKAWTNHELKSAQARAFLQQNEPYILPVRIDDTEIPGIRPTLAHLDLRQHTIEEVADFAAEKILSATPPSSGANAAGSRTLKVGAPLKARNLQIKKEFTELERDTFLEESFEEIAKIFEASLADLTAQHPGIVGRYRRLNANHFTAMIYRNGSSVSACGIRLGGSFGRNQIAYSADPNSTNSMNESVSVEDDGKSQFFKPMGFSSMLGGKKSKGNLTAADAAELFWEQLLAPLER